MIDSEPHGLAICHCRHPIDDVLYETGLWPGYMLRIGRGCEYCRLREVAKYVNSSGRNDHDVILQTNVLGTSFIPLFFSV